MNVFVVLLVTGLLYTILKVGILRNACSGIFRQVDLLLLIVVSRLYQTVVVKVYKCVV